MRSLLVDYEARSEVLACDLMPGGVQCTNQHFVEI